MLRDEGLDFEVREYTDEPLSVVELKSVLGKLGVEPSDVLRKRDAKELGLSGDETSAELFKLMASNPTLLERPIGVRGRKAVVGRPVDNLLELSTRR